MYRLATMHSITYRETVGESDEQTQYHAISRSYYVAVRSAKIGQQLAKYGQE